MLLSILDNALLGRRLMKLLLQQLRYSPIGGAV